MVSCRLLGDGRDMLPLEKRRIATSSGTALSSPKRTAVVAASRVAEGASSFGMDAMVAFSASKDMLSPEIVRVGSETSALTGEKGWLETLRAI